MKFATVEEAFASLAGKVIIFNKRCETDYECDADPNMKGRVKNVYMTNHNIMKVDIDLSEFEEYNDPLMQKNYYDKNGVPCLTMKEAGMYTGIETVYTEPNLILPFDFEPTEEEEKRQKIQKLANEYRPSMDKEVLHSWAAELVALLKK